MAETTLIIEGRDTWGDRIQDAIERAARGAIVAHKEDGRGGMRFYVRPRVRYRKPERKALLEAVRAAAGNARWAD